MPCSCYMNKPPSVELHESKVYSTRLYARACAMVRRVCERRLLPDTGTIDGRVAPFYFSLLSLAT